METAPPVNKETKTASGKSKPNVTSKYMPLSPASSMPEAYNLEQIAKAHAANSNKNGTNNEIPKVKVSEIIAIYNQNENNSKPYTNKIEQPVNKVYVKDLINDSENQEKEQSDNSPNNRTVIKVSELLSSDNQLPTPSTSSNEVTLSPSQPIAKPISNVPQEVTSPAIEPETTERTTPTNADSDVNFKAVISSVKTTAKDKKVHTTKNKAETSANQAASVPAGERKSKARGEQVDKMDDQKTGVFKAADFKIKLKAKIDQMQLPKTEEQADNFESNNNIAQVNNDAKGDVVAAKKNVTGAIETTAKQEPSEANIAQRTATELPDPKIGNKTHINIGKAIPPKRGNAEIKAPLEKKYQSLEQDLQQNQITDQQLSKSNEPSFNAALTAKNDAKQNVQAAPDKFRADENSQLTSAKNTGQNKANADLEAMHTSRKTLLNGVTEDQKQAGTKNTSESEKAVAKLNEIYASTKTAVDLHLGTLETTVTTLFDEGAKAAKAAFENHVDKKMTAYKKERYGSWYDVRGYGKRIGDTISGLPKEVEAFFVSGRQVFLNTLDGYITQIANIVASSLNSAKIRIATGRQEINSYLKGLPNDIKKSIKGDIDAIQGKFSELEENVNQKEADLINTLATKYKDTLTQVDARIDEMKAANEGLIGLAKRAILEVIAVIKNIKKVLTEILAAAADVIMAIISDPIGFLSNLFDGVAQGFTNFGTNILKHLQTGLMGWLTGAMDGMALQMPEDVFSLKGIFSITMQVLNLGWDGIRAIGSKVIGEPVMKALETGFEIVQIIRKDGISGLWNYLKDQFQDLKETVMNTIMDMLQNQVLQAGIKWVLGLLSPVGAFIKAAMAIIDTVKFFIQRAAQIGELVKAFIQSMAAIASGNVSAVATSIEGALGKAVPVLIGFLASLLGISGLADKVVGIVRRVRDRIVIVITKFWTFIKEKAKSVLSKIGFGKKKEKEKQSGGKLKDTELGKNVEFSDGHEQHHLWIINKGGNVEVMVASVAKTVKERIAIWEEQSEKLPEDEKIHANKLINLVKENYSGTLAEARIARDALVKAEKENTDANLKDAEQKDIKVENKEELLKNPIAQLFKLFNSNYEISPELKEIVEKLTGLPGAKGLIGFIESKKILPWFKHGFKTQAQRAIYYNGENLLKDIEAPFGKGKNLSRFDLIIWDKETGGKDKGDEIVVEVKNWTGFMRLSEIKQEERLRSLEDQLRKYKKSGKKVQLEWKGKIPDSVKLLCDDIKNINTKEI